MILKILAGMALAAISEVAWAQNVLPVDVYEVDQQSLAGKQVAVFGTPMCLSADMCYLYKADMSQMSGIIFDPTALPRADRLKLLSCNVYTSKCYTILHGISPESGPLPILKPNAIDWSDQPNS